MNKEQLAALLNNREYGREITPAEEAQAKAAGLVAIFGCSDDNVTLAGAISDQIGAYEGTTLRICLAGTLLQDFDDLDHDDEEMMARYFKSKATGFVEIQAIWCPKGEELSWAFQTDVPHATFLVMDNGEPPFCRGIVIDTADLAAAP